MSRAGKRAIRDATAGTIEYRPIGDLRDDPRNSRTHTDAQIADLRASFREFGWVYPILIREDGTVIAGHARLRAAREEGATEAKTLVATGLTDRQIRAYVIADNQLALPAGWDDEVLKAEIEALQEDDFDLSALGFNSAELERILLGELEATDPNAEWQGMPAFEHEDKTAFRSILVHFRDQAAVDEFAKVVELPITDRTRFLWYPETEIETYADKRYESVE